MNRLQEPVPAAGCLIPNIGTTGRDRRLRGGLIWLVAGMALTVACVAWRLPWPAFAGLFLVFYLAALGYFQAAHRT
jgi:hypothetical protein